MHKFFFSPSLMCADFLDIKSQINLLLDNKFEFLHLDVMDMQFVPNLALNFDLIKQLQNIPISKDIHLMVKNIPLALEQLHVRKDDYISFHIESSFDVKDMVDAIHRKGAHPGLVINPDTLVKNLRPHIPRVDLIHLMCAQTGFTGQCFIPDSYERAAKVVSLVQKLNPTVLVGVDGSIGFKQIELLSNLGVNVFVLGTTCLFKPDFKDQVKRFMKFKQRFLKTNHPNGIR